MSEFKVFEIAEIARFTPEEVIAYEDSLKVYRDLKNSIDTAREEGRMEGKEEGLKEKTIEMAQRMKEESEPVEKIMRYTGLTREEIEKLERE